MTIPHEPTSKRPSEPLVLETVLYDRLSVPLTLFFVARFKRFMLLKNNEAVRMDALFTG